MRIAIFDNLANSAYIQAKALHRLGHAVDLVLDPIDRYAMSDPRWEDLDIELSTDDLTDPVFPTCQLPSWVRRQPGTLAGRPNAHASRPTRALRNLWKALGLGSATVLAVRHGGRLGAWMAAERAWVIHTLATYDCVIAYGMGSVWAALAGVPFLAQTWGGDITMLPFYDTGDWESHEILPLPGPRGELFTQAKLQRMGYEHARRILLTDPRFTPYVERLGHSRKSVHLGFLIDVEKYVPGPEVELRRSLLKGGDGLIVFVPSRQDWHWKGSDRLLRGFAQVAHTHPEAVLVCAGWGADLERSRRLIGELGIGDRTRLLPYAMSKVRLRRYYCAADIVADQFTVGSYGSSALEAMSCARPLLINLEHDRFEGRFSTFPPVMNTSEPGEIAEALTRLIDDPQLRAELGSQGREWVITHHGPSLAKRVIELCHEVVEECSPQRRAARQ